MAQQLRVCKLSEINTGKTISGSEACRPGRPARLTIDKFKLHYFVHYMHRGTWDVLVPEEKEEDLGKIEAYHCNLCPRRFRNNHDKKSYAGRGSIMCHLANEHGKLIIAMRADDKVDMTDEIKAIDDHEKGQFIGAEDPNVPDNEMYTAKESFMWKFQNQRNLEQGKGNAANPQSTNSPKIVPFSKTEMAERGGYISTGRGDNPRRPKVYECPHCTECKNNVDPSRLRLHIFHHYKDRWEHRLAPLEKGPNYYYCNICTKRKQIKGGNEEGARISMICHFAIQHHELRDVLNRDERLPENFVSDLFYDIDLKEGKVNQNKPSETPPNTIATANTDSKNPVKVELENNNRPSQEPSMKINNSIVVKDMQSDKEAAKPPEPTRGRRPKAPTKGKIDEWLSSDEDEVQQSVLQPPAKRSRGRPPKGNVKK